jgi:hypothetical protein
MQAAVHPLPLSFPKSKLPLQLVATSAIESRPVSRTDPFDSWLEVYCRYQDDFLHDELAAGEGASWLQDMT